MKQAIAKNAKRLLPISILFIFACSQVPITGRNQLNIIPSSQLQELSHSQYQSFMKEHRVSDNDEWVSMVRRVGNSISAAVEDYLRETGNRERADEFSWEFNLVDSDEMNAFAMPGGKVVVYEGIVEMVDGDEAELATVMAHEIAHVIAEHGNERMSQQLLTQLGGTALNVALSEKPEQTQNLFMTAYGMGAQVGVLLPFSRTHESEADRLGLIFMAKAGYDPRQAVEFWDKMRARSGGASPPQFLSTHPAHEDRIEDIRRHMPQAMGYYRKAEK